MPRRYVAFEARFNWNDDAWKRLTPDAGGGMEMPQHEFSLRRKGPLR